MGRHIIFRFLLCSVVKKGQKEKGGGTSAHATEVHNGGATAWSRIHVRDSSGIHVTRQKMVIQGPLPVQIRIYQARRLQDSQSNVAWQSRP